VQYPGIVASMAFQDFIIRRVLSGKHSRYQAFARGVIVPPCACFLFFCWCLDHDFSCCLRSPLFPRAYQTPWNGRYMAYFTTLHTLRCNNMSFPLPFSRRRFPRLLLYVSLPLQRLMHYPTTLYLGQLLQPLTKTIPPPLNWHREPTSVAATQIS